MDGYFANLIRVRAACGFGWFLEFVLLLEFQSNVTFGNWTRSLRQLKGGMATSKFGPIARAVIKFWAAHKVSMKFLRVFKTSVSAKFLWGFKFSVSTKFLRVSSKVSTKFFGVSSQVCPLGTSGFLVKCVHKIPRGFRSSVTTKFLCGFKSSAST